ncbi:uncharacterized protein K444DRAFT_383309 [Hyaloscypha bicolor E]|uniref:Uncharacterized protein n=1 Tax=Hyaloscypha bicolor E TaxID=1095630 RepID=A0A2J6TD21_9HELO|nr:uncharacterized protein K444DRAFT_383309 [Hyaloscypha bicolor E]PMD60903.1 hypothetical protein K444DRAFT_383309 [Hyaloscypha bicolor E]
MTSSHQSTSLCQHPPFLRLTLSFLCPPPQTPDASFITMLSFFPLKSEVNFVALYPSCHSLRYISKLTYSSPTMALLHSSSKLFISQLTYMALPITAQTNTTSISISSKPTATFTTIASTISSLISTTPIPATLSSLIQTTSSSPTPAPTYTPPPKYTIPTTPLYIGVAFALLAFTLLIFLLLRLESFLYQRRQRANLLSPIPPNPHDGLHTLHLPELVHNTGRKHKKGDRRSRLEFQDGRRFGVVGLDFDNGDGKADVQSEEQGKRNRETFEVWKKARGFGTDWRDEDIRVDETVEERGRKRERRETFDAWKKGVVQPLKAEYREHWKRWPGPNGGRNKCLATIPAPVVQDPRSENPSAEFTILAVGCGFPRNRD